MIENKEQVRKKLPFNTTRQLYRERVESLINGPDEQFSTQLKSGKPIFLRVPGDTSLDPDRVIPISLPIDYKFSYGAPENAHHLAQIYLNGFETMDEVGELTGRTGQAVSHSFGQAIKDVLKDNPEGITIRDLNLDKSSSDEYKIYKFKTNNPKTYQIYELVKSGADYDKLKSEGFTAVEINYAENSFARFENPIIIRRNKPNWDEIVKVLRDPDMDKIVKFELMFDISRSVVRHNKDLFDSIKSLAERIPIKLSRKKRESLLIFDYLRSKGIPVVTYYYDIKSGPQKGIKNVYFVLKEFEEEALEMLREDEFFETTGLKRLIDN